MISETYKAMLSGKSVIRELSEHAAVMKKEIGEENVFDFSLGNPSVAVPKAYNDKLAELVSTCSPMLLHGYSPSLGIPQVKEKIAASLNRRFGMNYQGCDIFMASGAPARWRTLSAWSPNPAMRFSPSRLTSRSTARM